MYTLLQLIPFGTFLGSLATLLRTKWVIASNHLRILLIDILYLAIRLSCVVGNSVAYFDSHLYFIESSISSSTIQK